MRERSDRRLAQAIRSSPVLDRKLKDYWLRVLPYLDEAEKTRLWATLRRADQDLLDDPAGDARA